MRAACRSNALPISPRRPRRSSSGCTHARERSRLVPMRMWRSWIPRNDGRLARRIFRPAAGSARTSAVSSPGRWSEQLSEVARCSLTTKSSVSQVGGASRSPKPPVTEILERRLDELYAIGALPDGGTYRPLYGDAWARAVERVERWMKDAGLQAHRDPVGNVWGRAEGHNEGKAIVTGSHIDTVR